MSLFNFGFKKSASASVGQSSSSENRSPAQDSSLNEAEKDDELESNIERKVENPAKKVKRNPIRKYAEDYLKYGFICGGTDEMPQPLCLVCKNTLANAAMKPYQLKRHLETTHADLKEKPLDYFQRLKSEHKSLAKSIVSYSSTELNAIKSSFVAAYNIANKKKPFTLGEKLIKPVLSEITEILFGASAVPKVNAVPLSADTISRRVDEMAADIKNQLCSHLMDCGEFLCK